MGRSARPRHLGRTGSTLIELVVALVVFAVIIVGILMIWRHSQLAYFQGSEAAELQQNARVALEQMVREIRQAGYDPCRYSTTAPCSVSAFDPVTPGVFPIQAFAGSSLWVQADRNANSVIASDLNESVCFYRDGSGVLRRKTTGGDCSSGGEELARNITSLAFTYFKANGTGATTRGEIRLVRIDLSAEETQLGSPLTVTLRSDVVLRDR